MAIVNENGLKYAKLVHVSVDNGKTENSNKYYVMEETSDGKIRCEYGRVGKDGTVIYKPLKDWDKLIREKTVKKGYKDVTDLISESVSTESNPKNNLIENIKEKAVKDVIDKLMFFANKSIQENYTVTQESVTEKQVEEASALVDDILKLINIGVSKKTINDLLLELYRIIPRKMTHVKNHLISEINNDSDLQTALKLINNEKSALETMEGQVKLFKQSQEKKSEKIDKTEVDTKTTILDQMGVDMTEEKNPEVIKMITEFLGSHANKLLKVYHVINHKTQELFDTNLAKAADKKTRLYWHGSRNQNWFNITQTGLMIRPSGAGYNGSMWGDGIYFANSADKSMGYTDGGRWARGGSKNVVYLALFDVHLGKQLHFSDHCSEARHLSYQYLQQKGGYDSTYAHKGKSLYRDEFIIYRKEQCTIKYLIELRNN